VFQYLKGDKVIWMVAFILCGISILAVYSAGSTLGKTSEGVFSVLARHITMMVAGLAVMLIVHRLDFRYFSKFSQLLIWVSIILLGVTLLYGANINNADRWLKIPGLGISFQTSDLAKVVLLVYIARMLTLRREVLGDFKKGFLPIAIPIGLVCGLIFPANFSTCAMLGLVAFVVLIVGGFPLKYLSLMVGIVLFLLGMVIVIGEYGPKGFIGRYETWKNRIFNKMDDKAEGNYQSDLAKYAIYSGGMIPKGPGTGSSRNFMPHPYSDMIYAFIIEEWGLLLGGGGLVFLYIIFYFRSIRAAFNCPSRFGQLTAFGLGTLIVVQAMINMAVSVSLMPTTGQPLPLISLGGTSTIFTCLSIAIIISVSRGKGDVDEDHFVEENAVELTDHPLGV
jgi:cell division protein FtsW